MAIFKYSIKPDASEDERRTTVRPGPFLVDASDQDIGRQLLSVNFGIAVSRLIKSSTVLNVWRNSDASQCESLTELDNPEAVRQRREIAGIDVAAWLLAKPNLEEADGRYARMVWWPLGPEDRCPA